MHDHTLRSRCSELFQRVQSHICAAIEEVDGTATFLSDLWDRTDITGEPGGGGETRVLSNGSVFEKAGVNYSSVHGHLSPEFSAKLGGSAEQTPFFATGVSLVIHPRSPMVPTTHANWRFLEMGERAWFGGGSDLTPYYPYDQDAVHFHRVLRDTCAKHSPDFYPRFKKWCDEYFYLPHRHETRGIGGLFFDYLGKENELDHEHLFSFVQDLGLAFNDQYLPIVQSRKDEPYGDTERQFQLLRRGRYVEFNLLYDRGTHFGLQTGGRTESILMSLPPLVRWDYCPAIEPGSREARLLEILGHPQEWV